MKVHEAVPKVLVESGVNTIFGLMGDANMLVLTDFIRDHAGHYIAVTHESAAVSAADAYSVASGQLGVASVTHGPGLTNTVTSLTDAVRKRSQVLLISGDTPSRHAVSQNIDIRGLAAFTGAGYERAWDPQDVIKATDRALQRALAERLPIILDVPADLMLQEIPDAFQLSARRDVGAIAADPEVLDDALGLMVSAKKPVVLAGRGAVRSGARAVLLELADLIGAPLATSLLARDYFRGHPRNLGICGTLSTAVGGNAINESDCVVAFGASLNRFTAGMSEAGDGGSLLMGKRIVQCDIDVSRFGAAVPITVPVVGDATTVARTMVESLRDAGIAKSGTNLSQLESDLASESPFDEFTDASNGNTVDPRAAMIRLDEILPRERVVATDAGRYVLIPWRYVHVADPMCFVQSLQYGSIGLGMGTAIGAAIAHPNLLTVAILGDAGFMMNMSEFATAVSNHLRMIVVIVNDHALGAEYRKLKDYGVDPTYSCNDFPEFADVAEAMGGRGIAVRSLKELDVIADLIPDLDRPLLVDIKVDPALDTRA